MRNDWPLELTGNGQSVTQRLTLAERRWRVTFTVVDNFTAVFDERVPDHVALTAIDDGDGMELLCNEVVASGTWTAQFQIGGTLGLSTNGVFLEINVLSRATWTIVIQPL
ncbi:MAG: hypothetical protein OXB92_03180 [Acidimicrobiaceae bacterium]|nr:hypothetical protein [Acidimicrobiia bacterium]MCY4492846.1 hypothetical protein [Acidimicrobiaceae bacterium]